MTHPGRSRKGDTRPTSLLSPKLTTLFGTCNVKTVYEALKAAQIAAEMTTFKLSILAINDQMDRVWVHKIGNRTYRPLLRP